MTSGTDPFRAGFKLTFAAEDIESADDRWEAGVSALIALGFLLEGGTVERMDPDDVIEGSPLAKRLE